MDNIHDSKSNASEHRPEIPLSMIVTDIIDDIPPNMIIDEDDLTDELVTAVIDYHNQSLLGTRTEIDLNEEIFDRIGSNPEYMDRINYMINMAVHVFPMEAISADFIKKQVFHAFIEKDRDMSINDCVDWGGDFVIPADEIKRNSALFRDCNHDFPEFIRKIQEVHLENRFNEQRVLNCMSPSDIDYEIILEMSKGIKIITSDDWLPNFHLGNPKLRLKYIKAHHGLNKKLLLNKVV